MKFDQINADIVKTDPKAAAKALDHALRSREGNWQDRVRRLVQCGTDPNHVFSDGSRAADFIFWGELDVELLALLVKSDANFEHLAAGNASESYQVYLENKAVWKEEKSNEKNMFGSPQVMFSGFSAVAPGSTAFILNLTAVPLA